MQHTSGFIIKRQSVHYWALNPVCLPFAQFGPTQSSNDEKQAQNPDIIAACLCAHKCRNHEKELANAEDLQVFHLLV